MPTVKPFALKYVAFPRIAAEKLSIPALGLYVYLFSLSGEITTEELSRATRIEPVMLKALLGQLIRHGFIYGDSDHFFVTDYEN